MRNPLYYIQFKTGYLPEDSWQNLVAFPMSWEKAQQMFPSLQILVGEDHPLRITDYEAD